MRFRPCIDIHNGKVKQIVGGTLRDAGESGARKEAAPAAGRTAPAGAGRPASSAAENFVSDRDAGWYASLYRSRGLTGGHIILLNPAASPEYQEDLQQAERALDAWPGGMQIGGGIRPENASSFLDMGASHVIVTSAVFDGPRLDRKQLLSFVREVGREHLVLDLSCRKRDGRYYVVTDRWQTFTDLALDSGVLEDLSASCAGFLIHGVDQEGRRAGFSEDLIRLLARADVPVTYAGGIGTIEDIRNLKELSNGRIDFTVGSALDLFGGALPFEDVIREAENV